MFHSSKENAKLKINREDSAKVSKKHRNILRNLAESDKLVKGNFKITIHNEDNHSEENETKKPAILSKFYQEEKNDKQLDIIIKKENKNEINNIDNDEFIDVAPDSSDFSEDE